ncbi:HNH endonuclease [Tellurirhabdus rosea]|uniref:HNH endonuclease n=1 Tax=Tellurirhabdus rosea TaxID=2674997 RepID=UPI002256056D|nr:hypothetical protein [Tellurirhabdus rosea]
MNLYKKSQWKVFRDTVFELDGNVCSVCGRSKEETILQVHHKKYIRGRNPWEYATQECITLCRGCHAAEHGLIMPKHGWEYVGDEDLGDLVGKCECCGSSLRYIYYILHQDWGVLEVGTHCCDLLTDSNIASNLKESRQRYEERRERFLSSSRWKQNEEILVIKQLGYFIEIRMNGQMFSITINGKRSYKTYQTIDDAKSKVFEVIETGKLMEYFNRNLK